MPVEVEKGPFGPKSAFLARKTRHQKKGGGGGVKTRGCQITSHNHRWVDGLLRKLWGRHVMRVWKDSREKGEETAETHGLRGQDHLREQTKTNWKRRKGWGEIKKWGFKPPVKKKGWGKKKKKNMMSKACSGTLLYRTGPITRTTPRHRTDKGDLGSERAHIKRGRIQGGVHGAAQRSMYQNFRHG